MAVLVIAEHDNKELKSATLNTITAAQAFATDIELLVAGHNCKIVAEAAQKIHSISKVMLADAEYYEHFLAENLAELITSIAEKYSHIMAPSDTFGKNFMPRVAAKLDIAQLTDVIEIISENTFKRPIYAGNAIATVESCDNKKILTIRTTNFAKAEIGSGNAILEGIDAGQDSGKSSFIKMQGTDSSGPDLTSARVVISGGRGVGSTDNFKLLQQLADKIGNAAIGASRAAVDAGYVPNDYQVGQTGKIVAPELYIAVGISGAIQHLAGMKDSKLIVAINKDENAPIFDIADYGIVADLFEAVPKMIELL